MVVRSQQGKPILNLLSIRVNKMSTAKPKAVFFTGTNGSGKSSMREHMLKYGKFDQEYVHIDADKIARDINPQNPRAADLEAGRLAIGKFNQALSDKRSFSMETTLAGNSSLDRIQKAKDAGYEVDVYHVGLAHPDLNVVRVQSRVNQGGHHIDEAVIRKRFHQSQENLKQVIDRKLADNLYVVDNSDKHYRLGIAAENNQLVYANKHIDVGWIKDVGQGLHEQHTHEKGQLRRNDFSVEGVEQLQSNTPMPGNGLMATMAMRRERLDEAERNVGESVRDLWQQPDMAPTLAKIKQLADKYGVSDGDVLAKMKGGDTLDQALDKEIGEVMRDSVAVQDAVNKIGGALADWRRSHGRLCETAGHMIESNHPLTPDTVKALARSEATLAVYAENAPSNGQLGTDLGLTQDYIKQSQQNRHIQMQHAQNVREAESSPNYISPNQP